LVGTIKHFFYISLIISDIFLHTTFSTSKNTKFCTTCVGWDFNPIVAAAAATAALGYMAAAALGVFSKSFHLATCLSSIFSISFHISTYLSSIFSISFHNSTWVSSEM
jgi:hypothetical protein